MKKGSNEKTISKGLLLVVVMLQTHTHTHTHTQIHIALLKNQLGPGFGISKNYFK